MNSITRYFLIIWLCILNIVNSCRGSLWCEDRMDCVINGKTHKHLLCGLKFHSSIAGCNNIKIITDANMRKELVKLHNKFRDKMASGRYKGWSKASNMMLMSWDAQLEFMSAISNVQCKSDHLSQCRRFSNFDSAGMCWSRDVSPKEYRSPERMFHILVRGMDDTNEKTIDSYLNKVSVQTCFTQAVAAVSYKVGCSMMHSIDGDLYATLLTCMYAPEAGNVMNGFMYNRGAPCSDCPSGSDCDPTSKFPNLCIFYSSTRYDYDYDVVGYNVKGSAGIRSTHYKTSPTLLNLTILLLLLFTTWY